MASSGSSADRQYRDHSPSPPDLTPSPIPPVSRPPSPPLTTFMITGKIWLMAPHIDRNHEGAAGQPGEQRRASPGQPRLARTPAISAATAQRRVVTSDQL